MGWKDLLQEKEDLVVLPWVGGRVLRSGPRAWKLSGPLPKDHGWVTFRIHGRNASVGSAHEGEIAREPCVQPPGTLGFEERGYLVGDRFVRDDAVVNTDPKKIAGQTETVHLIDEGLDRFVRVEVGRACEDGPLVFSGVEMPLGPEDEVLQTFLDGGDSVSHIKGVTPALEAAFRMECWQKEETEKRRKILEEERRKAEEIRLIEERRQEIVSKLGDGAGRREMARVDFDAAAKAALIVGGAELLDVRGGVQSNEKIVKYRLDGRRYECVCDKDTLRIVDAGICLTDVHTREKGDSYFTLESLPSVIMEAIRENKLVVYRRVDNNYPGNEDDDDD